MNNIEKAYLNGFIKAATAADLVKFLGENAGKSKIWNFIKSYGKGIGGNIPRSLIVGGGLGIGADYAGKEIGSHSNWKPPIELSNPKLPGGLDGARAPDPSMLSQLLNNIKTHKLRYGAAGAAGLAAGGGLSYLYDKYKPKHQEPIGATPEPGNDYVLDS